MFQSALVAPVPSAPGLLPVPRNALPRGRRHPLISRSGGPPTPESLSLGPAWGRKRASVLHSRANLLTWLCLYLHNPSYEDKTSLT